MPFIANAMARIELDRVLSQQYLFPKSSQDHPEICQRHRHHDTTWLLDAAVHIIKCDVFEPASGLLSTGQLCQFKTVYYGSSAPLWTGISALILRGAGIETAPKFVDLKGRSALRSPAVAYSGEIVNGPFCWELGLPIGGI